MIAIILSVLSIAANITAICYFIRNYKELRRIEKELSLLLLKTELGIEEITEAL